MIEINPVEESCFSPILVINAHPDDESFGFGGVISLAGKDFPIYVASLTHGESGCNAIGSGSLGEIRKIEYFNALKNLGVDESHGVMTDLPDGSLDKVHGTTVATIRNLISKIKPGVVCIMHPASTSHQDHLEVSNIVIQEKRDGADFALLMQYLPHKYKPQADEKSISVDITPYMEQKIKAINEHRTQTSDIEKILPKLLGEEYYIYEQ